MSASRKPRQKTDSILHRDIKELEISKSLRRLGSIRVTEWEIRDVLPAVNRLAQKEVDLAGMLKRTANYRVTEWDIKDLLVRRQRGGRRPEPPSPDVMDRVEENLRRFVGFVAKNLIDRPGEAEITTWRPTPGFLAIKLVLAPRDAAALIGHGGHTAAAIRAIVRDVAGRHGARISLRILSRKEDEGERRG